MNANNIDLASSWGGNGTESYAAAVSIPENLPGAYEEMWHECIDIPQNGSYAESHVMKEYPAPPAGGKKTEDERWNFIMNKLINIENNTCNLTQDFNTLSTKVEGQAGLLEEVKTATASNEKSINELYKNLEAVTAEVDRRVAAQMKLREASMQQENFSFKAEVLKEAKDMIREETKEIKDDVLQGKCNFRKINLLVVGIKEAEGENLKEKVSSFFTKNMALPGIKMDASYRLGKPGGDNARPILVRFSSMPHRQRVWFAKSKIKEDEVNGKVWIQEDLPRAAKHVHRTFYKILRKAKSMGGQFEGAHIRGHNLYIDGQAYGEDDVESLPDVLRPSNMATLQSQEAVAFFGRSSPLSNHHPSPFTLDGNHYTCMEQFLAWSKATMAGNQPLISKASAKADPIVYKGILNELRDSVPEDWKAKLDSTVLRGLRAKFQYNPTLTHFLCSTHPRIIGEASLSKTWGIGLFLTHQNVLKPEKWPAEGNLLGKSLMTIREELMATKNA